MSDAIVVELRYYKQEGMGHVQSTVLGPKEVPSQPCPARAEKQDWCLQWVAWMWRRMGKSRLGLWTKGISEQGGKKGARWNEAERDSAKVPQREPKLNKQFCLHSIASFCFFNTIGSKQPCVMPFSSAPPRKGEDLMKRLHDRGMWEYDEDFPKDEEEPLGYSGFEWLLTCYKWLLLTLIEKSLPFHPEYILKISSKNSLRQTSKPHWSHNPARRSTTLLGLPPRSAARHR